MTEAREIVLRLQLEYPPAGAPEPAVITADPLLYRIREAARLLALGESTVDELIARGELESVKIGASRRITRAGLEQYVRRLVARGGDEDAPAA